MESSFSEVVDCSRCPGWCCQAYAFEAGDGFGHTKAAGERCRYLTLENRCRVYTQRAQGGYAGCVGYTCYGAGPRLSEVASPGASLEVWSVFFALRDCCKWGWVVERLLDTSRGPSGVRLPASARERLEGLYRRLQRRVFGQTEWSSPDLCSEAVAVASEVREIARALPEVVNSAVEWRGPLLQAKALTAPRGDL